MPDIVNGSSPWNIPEFIIFWAKFMPDLTYVGYARSRVYSSGSVVRPVSTSNSVLIPNLKIFLIYL